MMSTCRTIFVIEPKVRVGGTRGQEWRMKGRGGGGGGRRIKWALTSRLDDNPPAGPGTEKEMYGLRKRSGRAC